MKGGRGGETHIDNTLDAAEDVGDRRAHEGDFREEPSLADHDVEQLLENTGELGTVWLVKPEATYTTMYERRQ